MCLNLLKYTCDFLVLPHNVLVNEGPQMEEGLASNMPLRIAKFSSSDDMSFEDSHTHCTQMPKYVSDS